jgi:hypothetical protein
VFVTDALNMHSTPTTQRRNGPGAPSSQRGAASLIIVMVLFFVLTMVAAYTSRNLLFEQRISANQARSTQALEAAEAGIEWAVAQLSSGRIMASCTASADSGDISFRQRYVGIDDAGLMRARRRLSDGGPLWPGCFFDVRSPENALADETSGSWVCDCPADAAPSLSAPAGTGLAYPAFRVRFITFPTNGGSVEPLRPGTIRIESRGCTQLIEGCLDFGPTPVEGEGQATISVVLALHPVLKTPPSAAVTVGGNVELGDNPVQATNTDAASSGLILHVAGTIGAATRAATEASAVTIGGQPVERAIIEGDASLLLPAMAASGENDANRFFAGFMGVLPSVYREKPLVVHRACAPVCDGAQLRELVKRHPGRPLWLKGEVVLDGDIGESPPSGALQPVLVIVEDGSVTSSGGGTLHGVMYLRRSSLAAASYSINGALIVEEGLVGTSSTPSVAYNPNVLSHLRLQQGSFVRVPGSWRDFR